MVRERLVDHIKYSPNYGVPLGPLAFSSLAFLFLNKKVRLEIASGPNGTPYQTTPFRNGRGGGQARNVLA